MPWPNIWPFNSSRKDDNSTSPVEQLKEEIQSTSWNDFTRPSTIISTVALTTGILLGSRFYKRNLRRIPAVAHIRPAALRKSSVFGKVTSVGDGDNFRIFHTPGGRLAGWGWMPGRQVPDKREALKDQTLHIRIAGIDAPELAHFGRPAQPYGQEALDFLTTYILHKRVRAYIYRKDQYERVVGTVWVRKWGFKKDVGLEMLKRGLATVYEAKFGSEFGSREEEYRRAEQTARERGVGMWKEPSVWERLTGAKKKTSESPREFKTRMIAEERAKAATKDRQ